MEPGTVLLGDVRVIVVAVVGALIVARVCAEALLLAVGCQPDGGGRLVALSGATPERGALAVLLTDGSPLNNGSLERRIGPSTDVHRCVARMQEIAQTEGTRSRDRWLSPGMMSGCRLGHW